MPVAGQDDTALLIADDASDSVSTDVLMNYDIFNVHESVSPLGSTNNLDFVNTRNARKDLLLMPENCENFSLSLSN